MKPLNEPTLWAQDLEAILEIAVEHGLTFPFSIMLTAADGSVMREEIEHAKHLRPLAGITRLLEEWQRLLPITVRISDHGDRILHARIEDTPATQSYAC